MGPRGGRDAFSLWQPAHDPTIPWLISFCLSDGISGKLMLKQEGLSYTHTHIHTLPPYPFLGRDEANWQYFLSIAHSASDRGSLNSRHCLSLPFKANDHFSVSLADILGKGGSSFTSGMRSVFTWCRNPGPKSLNNLTHSQS